MLQNRGKAMNYDEALSYMLSLNKRGIHPGLSGVKLLCDACGNPENRLKVISVVGTDGKGSTSLLISEILRAEGLKVGLFSSPAVFSDREIISVNGRDITKQDYVNLVEELSKLNDFGCTRFEVETIMALKHFENENVDVAIMEAGMGGLLDSTNVVPSNIASVFTAIGLDHTEHLGTTVEAIAENKTGVIKDDSITVTTSQLPEVMEIIKKNASLHNNSVVLADYALAKNVKFRLSGTSFDYKDLKGLTINLLGTFQVQNAVLAIEAARALAYMGIEVSEKAIRKGLLKARKPGRFEKVQDKPLMFVDGAHTPQASLRLRETLTTYFTKKKIIYIMGMLRDKDVAEVVKNTVDLASAVFTVATSNKARTLSSFELAEVVKTYNNMVTSVDGIKRVCGLMDY